ncbi:MAG: lipoyl(octanoyl) transferase LipB [Polyangia bacterium]
MQRWTVEDLGRRDYAEVLAYQHELVARRQRDELEDRLLLVEHPEVVTLGRRRGSADNVLALNPFPVVEIERGGDVTYHGPGQLVAYPIVKLDGNERDLHLFLRNMEEAIMRTCAELGLSSEREPEYTGVWVGPRNGLWPERRKIASMGIAVRRWITFHGLALNVSTDLSHFGVVNPCGLEAQVMTSLSRELGRDVALAEVKPLLANHLGSTLGRTQG